MSYHYSQAEIRAVLVRIEEWLNTMGKRNSSRHFYENERVIALNELLKVQLKEFDRL